MTQSEILLVLEHKVIYKNHHEIFFYMSGSARRTNVSPAQIPKTSRRLMDRCLAKTLLSSVGMGLCV